MRIALQVFQGPGMIPLGGSPMAPRQCDNGWDQRLDFVDIWTPNTADASAWTGITADSSIWTDITPVTGTC